MFTRTIALVSLLVLSIECGQAQDFTPLAKSLPQLESLLKLHSDPNTQFQGKLTLTVAPTDGRPPFTFPARISYADNKLRCEVTSTTELQQGVGQPDDNGGPVVFVFDGDKKGLWVVYPASGTYREVKMSDSALSAYAAKRLNTELTVTKTETEEISGQKLSKITGVLRKDGKDVGKSKVWYSSTGALRFPVKIETGDTNQVTTITLSDIEAGMGNTAGFQPPGSYRKISNGRN